MRKVRSERCYLVSFEDGGKGPRAKECECPLEAGKSTEIDSPQELVEALSPATTLVLVQ